MTEYEKSIKQEVNMTEDEQSVKKRRPRWGDEENVTAISHLRCQASWSGFPKCIPHSASENAIYQPLPGWGIVENNVAIESSNNGSRAVSTIAGGGKFISESDLNLSYSVVMDIAVKAGRTDIAAKLKQDYAEHRKELISWEANKNTIHASVRCKAHGSCIDQKRGWEQISVKARLRYIGEPNAGTLIKNLLEDNGLSSLDSFNQLSSPEPGKEKKA